MYPEYDIWLGRVELNKDLQREASRGEWIRTTDLSVPNAAR